MNRDKTNKSPVSASEYNKNARTQGRDDWRTAYRTDVLKKPATNQATGFKAPTNQKPDTKKAPAPTGAWNVSNAGPETKDNKITNQLVDQGKLPKDQKETFPSTYKPVASYQEWVDRGQKPIELTDLVENKYWVTAEYDPKTNKVVWYDQDWNLTKEWSFDEWGFAVRKDIEVPKTWETFLNEYQGLINAGATDKDVKKYIVDNYDLAQENKEQVRTLYKGFLKQNKITTEANRLSSLDWRSLYDSYKKNDFVKWDDVWNAMTPESQTKFNEFYAMNVRKNIRNWEEIVASVESDDPEEIYAKMSLYNPTYQDKYNEIVINNSERSGLRTDMSELNSDLTSLQRKYKNIEKGIRAKYPSASETQIEKIMRKEQKALMNQIEAKTDEYNVKMSEYNLVNADAQAEFQAYQADAGLDYETYQEAVKTSVDRYNTNQAFMNQKEIIQMWYDQANLTRQKNEEYQWKVTQFNAKRSDEQGQYQVNANWELMYLVKWTASKVLDATGKVVATEKTKNYEETLQDNDYGGYDVIRTYNDWSLPTIMSYDMKWNLVWGTPVVVSEAIMGIKSEWLWCGQWVNQYLKNLWVEWNTFWNSYESKTSKINSAVPQVWAVAIWNPNSWQWEYKEYGHVGIITDISPDWETLTITDWNFDGDKTKKTHKVDRSVIEYNGGYHTPKLAQADTGNGITDEPTSPADNWIKVIESGSMDMDTVFSKLGTNENALALKNEIVSKLADRGGKIYKKETDSSVKSVVDLRDTVKELLDNEWQLENVSGAVQSWNMNWITKSKDDYLAKLAYVLKGQTLQSLIDAKANGATFGALSNEELRMLQDSASEIASWMKMNDEGKLVWLELSEDNFRNLLKKLYNNLDSSVWLMTWKWVDLDNKTSNLNFDN